MLEQEDGMDVVTSEQCKYCLVKYADSTAPSPLCVQAEEGDYLSRIAMLANVPVEQLLADNIQQVPDLSSDLTGKDLLLCKP